MHSIRAALGVDAPAAPSFGGERADVYEGICDTFVQ
jgi:hypothetical protein